jgi:WD40 repeat protein
VSESLLNFRLLLVNGQGEATCSPLRIRTLREFPGAGGLSVHFRPVRNDLLFESAKLGGGLAHRVLSGEGIVRGQLWVEFEVPGAHANVIGHSSDLLFALALTTSTWTGRAADARSIAATGVLDRDGTVRSVERVVAKVAAAVGDLQSSGNAVVFYPAADRDAVESWRITTEIPAHVELRPVAHLEEALGHLGYVLEKVYLRSPFRGLEPFDYGHHSIFFGREREVRDVLQQLLRREEAGVPGLLVEGPSGSGKSSFLRAGVLPALVQPRSQPDITRERMGDRPLDPGSGRAIWRPGLLPPDVDALGLVQSIRECWRAFAPLQMGWDEDAHTLAELARKRREHWPTTQRFVWMIDQFEEIFAIGMDAALIETLGSFLGQLQTDGVWTLAAVRADAMPHLKRYEALRRVFGANEGQYYLAVLSGPALDDVIALPARAGDLEFEVSPEGQSLDQVLREEAYLEQDSLPLLQFTLNELYLRRSGNELTFAAYRQLGGLTGSVATTAQAVLSTEAADSRAVPRLFRSLVSVDEAGHASRRYASLSEISQDPTQQRLTHRLVEARLCVTDQRDGEPVVAFAHDSLLRTLPAITDWLKQEAGLLQTRELAQREARLWQQHGEADSWLATSDKLLLFKSLDTAEVVLSDAVREFIRRSQRRVRRTLRIKQAAIGSICLLAIAASAGAWIAAQKQQEAEFQTAQTFAAQTRLLTETASARLKEGDVDGAQAIIVEVLTKRVGGTVSTAALNVFQQARAEDVHILTITGHAGRVRRAAFSPDGKHIVTASDDRTARIWDAATGRQLLVLSGHTGVVFSVMFSPDGREVVTASDDHTARIWDSTTGQQMSLLSGHTDRVSYAAFSPEGKQVVTASADKTARTWNVATGRQVLMLSGHTDRVYSTAFSPDGKQIVTASADATVRTWNAVTGRQVLLLSGHTDRVYSAVFSSDSKQLVTASADKTARVWDAATGRQVLMLSGHTHPVNSAAFSPDGTQIVTASWDKTARTWNVATGQQALLLSGHTDYVNSARFSPDGKQVVTASYDKTVRTWYATRRDQSLVLSGHTVPLHSVRYSPDGKQVITASDDGTARIWDAATGRQVLVLSGHTHPLNSAAFSPDGKQIVTASDDKTIRTWDAATGRQLLLLSGGADWVTCAEYSPDGTRILTTSFDKTAQIWDAATGRQMLRLTGHKDALLCAAFSPDGRRVVTASLDGTARIWDALTGRHEVLLSGHTEPVNFAVFSPDGKQVVTASDDKTARIWDVATGRQVLALIGHADRVACARFSARGNQVVTASDDKTARIWDAATGQPLKLLGGDADPLGAAEFSPDDEQIVTGSDDKTARIWDARIQPLDVQLAYTEAAQFDPLPATERFQLGLPTQSDVRSTGAGDPNALARFGSRATDAASAEQDRTKKNALLLESFGYYASAAEVSRIDGRPDEVWRVWRYRRASLARLLGHEGMMREVTEVFERVRKEYARPNK